MSLKSDDGKDASFPDLGFLADGNCTDANVGASTMQAARCWAQQQPRAMLILANELHSAV